MLTVAENISTDYDEIINAFYNYSAMDQVAVIGDNRLLHANDKKNAVFYI